MIKTMAIVIYTIMILRSITTSNWESFAGWLCALILVMMIEENRTN